MILPPAIATQTVVRLRATDGAPDTHGNVTQTWTDQATISGCSIQPVEGSEFNEGRQTVITRWQWFGPTDADVTSKDRIVFEGDTYEIDGSVKEWSVILPHKSALLKRVEE
jgi:hypothetical protein